MKILARLAPNLPRTCMTTAEMAAAMLDARPVEAGRNSCPQETMETQGVCTGPRGPAGATGPAGPAGPRVPEGPQGATGINKPDWAAMNPAQAGIRYTDDPVSAGLGTAESVGAVAFGVAANRERWRLHGTVMRSQDGATGASVGVAWGF